MDTLDAQPSDRLARPDALERLVDAILEGNLYPKIALEWGVSKSRLMRWIAADSARSARAREARRLGAAMWEAKAEQVLEGATDEFSLKRARELAHHYRWCARCMDPKEYGDKLEVEQTINVSEASEGTLARELASLGMAGAALAATKGSNVH